jgi:hypothetical protein
MSLASNADILASLIRLSEEQAAKVREETMALMGTALLVRVLIQFFFTVALFFIPF